jgi:hypothetical protein
LGASLDRLADSGGELATPPTDLAFRRLLTLGRRTLDGPPRRLEVQEFEARLVSLRDRAADRFREAQSQMAALAALANAG